MSWVDAKKDVKDATRLVILCACLGQAQELLSKDMCDVMKMQRPTGDDVRNRRSNVRMYCGQSPNARWLRECENL